MCSKCDEFSAKISHLEAQPLNEANAATAESLGKLKAERELHHQKAEVFYARKKAAKEKAKKDPETLAAAFN